MLYSIILLISPLLVIGPLFVIIVNPPDISTLLCVSKHFSIPVISRSIYKPFRLYTHSPYEVVSGIIRYRCNEI